MFRRSPAAGTSASIDRFRHREIVLLLALFGLLVALRLPGTWAEGRFQDEEATVFLAYAWNFPWTEALLRPFGGYLNLVANGSTLLLARAVQGGLLPLEHAPYATMLLGLAGQLIPAFLVLTGEARWLGGKRRRALMLLALAVPPATEEVLLNAMHVQFHLALAVALILAVDAPRTRGRKILTGMILLFAPLCGPGAIVFLPLLVLRALVERHPGRIVQVGLLGFGSALQLGFFYGQSPMRGLELPALHILAAMGMRFLVLPFTGKAGPNQLIELIPGAPWLLYALALLLLLGVAALALSAWRRRDHSLWLLAAGVLILGVTLGAGMVTRNPMHPFVPIAGPRYNYLPLSLLGLLLIAACRPGPWRRSGLVAPALATIFLLVGTYSYFKPKWYYAGGPSWRQEVQAWRKDPNHPLKVWPAPFAADLSGRAVACRPPGPLGDATAPRYCESGWVAFFHRPGASGTISPDWPR